MHCAPFLLTMQIIFASVSYRRVVADLRVYAILMLMHSLIKYIRQTNSILEKYKHSKYNRTIHNYVIYSILPISVIGGILFYVILYKTVIIPYALRGKFFFLIDC